jgi:hypothetical protein
VASSTNPMDKAAAAFKKEERQREGAKAMAEYRAAQAAEEKKTERLRALRLAQEATEGDAAAIETGSAPESRTKTRKTPPRKPRAKKKRN